MNKMKLFGSKTSPFARKVRVVVEELGLTEQVEEVITDPYNPTPEFLAVNPLAKIPALLTPSGENLPDSRLIIEYLLTQGKGLMPLPRGSKRWAALRRMEVGDGIITAAVASFLEKKRPESIIYTQFLDRQTEVIRRCVELLNVDSDVLTRDSASLVEVTVGVALGYLDLRMPYLDWRRRHDALADWYAVFSQRPSMLKTAPPA